MNELPKNFPEYSIMYKVLLKKIKELDKEKQRTQKDELDKIELKLKKYQTELNKIEKMFPDGFFNVNN